MTSIRVVGPQFPHVLCVHTIDRARRTSPTLTEMYVDAFRRTSQTVFPFLLDANQMHLVKPQ